MKRQVIIRDKNLSLVLKKIIETWRTKPLTYLIVFEARFQSVIGKNIHNSTVDNSLILVENVWSYTPHNELMGFTQSSIVSLSRVGIIQDIPCKNYQPRPTALFGLYGDGQNFFGVFEPQFILGQNF